MPSWAGHGQGDDLQVDLPELVDPGNQHRQPRPAHALLELAEPEHQSLLELLDHSCAHREAEASEHDESAEDFEEDHETARALSVQANEPSISNGTP